MTDEQAYLAGDAEVYEKIDQWIRRAVRRFCYVPQDREDLVQEVHLELIKSLNAKKLPKVLFSYVYQIAVCVCADYARERIKQPLSLEKIDERFWRNGDPGARNMAEKRLEKRDSLDGALEELPKTYRTVIDLRLRGLSFKTVGALLGISTHAAEVRAARYRRILKRIVAKIPS
jgi:RNA polymerase sigma factor (sigma-70 family)